MRELLDNAVDSGATQIAVELVGGGIESVRVVDNGSGMTHKSLAHARCGKGVCTCRDCTQTVAASSMVRLENGRKLRLQVALLIYRYLFVFFIWQNFFPDRFTDFELS